MVEALASPPVIHKPAWKYTLTVLALEVEASGSAVQGHPQIHNEFWAYIKCITFHLTENK